MNSPAYAFPCGLLTCLNVQLILIKNHSQLGIFLPCNQHCMLFNWIYRSENCWHMYPFSIVNNKILKRHSIIPCWLSRKDNQTVVDNNRRRLREKKGKTGNKDIFVLLNVGWARFPIKFINLFVSTRRSLSRWIDHGRQGMQKGKAIKKTFLIIIYKCNANSSPGG